MIAAAACSISRPCNCKLSRVWLLTALSSSDELATLNWTHGPWSASWRIRYIGRTQVGSEDAEQQLSADLSIPAVVRKVGAYAYHNVQAGYDIAAWHTRLDLGIDNLGDKQPPLLYQNNVTNSNTDVATYDVMGRYYWLRATLTF